MPQPQLTFSAFDLNTWASHPANRRSSFIPSLTTGTMPNSQGSAVSVLAPQNAVVATNAVPSATPSGAATFNSSGTLPIVVRNQNQNFPPSAQPAPWIKIPACQAANFRRKPVRGIGLASAMMG